MSESKFFNIMSGLGYEFVEREENKFTFEKKTNVCSLMILFDVDKKYINPVLVANRLICSENDMKKMVEYFLSLKKDAAYLARLSNYKLLNN